MLTLDLPAARFVPPPLSFDDLVAEIIACSDLDRDTARAKLWQQLIGPGNVELDAGRFGISPHQYDAAMERLYRESDGFIFETLVYGQRPGRRKWNTAALHRIERYARRADREVSSLRILMFGDGCGQDSLFLAAHGCRVDYFDLPGSRTFAFAARRFAHHGVLDHGVRICTDLAALPDAAYDVVISLEVLEHLTQPHDAIEAMARLLKPGGIALVSEAFDCVSVTFSTHLACNLPLRDTTRFLFLHAGLIYTWTNPVQPDKPTEFQRRRLSLAGRLRTMLRVRPILRSWLILLRRGRWSDALRF